jgi:hypothetical protein
MNDRTSGSGKGTSVSIGAPLGTTHRGSFTRDSEEGEILSGDLVCGGHRVICKRRPRQPAFLSIAASLGNLGEGRHLLGNLREGRKRALETEHLSVRELCERNLEGGLLY